MCQIITGSVSVLSNEGRQGHKEVPEEFTNPELGKCPEDTKETFTLMDFPSGETDDV